MSREKDINSLQQTEAEHSRCPDVVSADDTACFPCRFWGNKTADLPAQSELSPRGPVPSSARTLWAALGFTSIQRNGPVHWETKLSTISTTVLDIQPTVMKVKLNYNIVSNPLRVSGQAVPLLWAETGGESATFPRAPPGTRLQMTSCEWRRWITWLDLTL